MYLLNLFNILNDIINRNLIDDNIDTSILETITNEEAVLLSNILTKIRKSKIQEEVQIVGVNPSSLDISELIPKLEFGSYYSDDLFQTHFDIKPKPEIPKPHKNFSIRPTKNYIIKNIKPKQSVNRGK